MTLSKRLQKLFHRVRQEGLASLPGWAWRWLYWNIGLYRLRSDFTDWPPALYDRVRRRTDLPVCDDISAWCAQHPGALYQVVSGRRAVRRVAPRTLEPSVDPSFASLLELEAPERALVAIPGARVIGPNGLALLPDGQFVGELVALTPAGRRNMLAEEATITQLAPPPDRRLAGDYCLLSALGWPNYYHWNHDVIMRMATVMPHLSPGMRFLVPTPLKPFHFESLSMLGIDRDRLTDFDGQAPIEVERLWFSTPLHKTQITSPEYAGWFRQVAVARWGGVPAAPHRRIYLVRPPSLDTHYRVTNDEEVQSYLTRRGFELCAPYSLSLPEQARLFAEAQIIIGTGTGLTNMVYAPPGAQIVQFQEPSKIVHALWTLSEALGHAYWYLLGDTVANPDPRQSLPDIYVPLAKLSTTLDHVLTAAAVQPASGLVR
ncbi:MAG: glycosyltransferase family 61 protein [Anaerolineales bacterium]|nr:glycosyltransferase family 61 protein [Anaerolineales bacterium]